MFLRWWWWYMPHMSVVPFTKPTRQVSNSVLQPVSWHMRARVGATSMIGVITESPTWTFCMGIRAVHSNSRASLAVVYIGHRTHRIACAQRSGVSVRACAMGPDGVVMIHDPTVPERSMGSESFKFAVQYPHLNPRSIYVPTTSVARYYIYHRHATQACRTGRIIGLRGPACPSD